MADQVLVLGVAGSPFAMRVKIALDEKGIEYEWREDDLSNKSSLLLEMNPVAKQIPVLIHKGNPICESMIIVEYIDEVWNHTSPNILPTDPYEKAKARFWADFVDKKVVLLGAWASPFVMRVKIALAEKGIEYESREEDLSNKSSLLLGMNPVNKRIPVLIHNGRPVCESMMIVEYIDEVWRNQTSPNFLPTDPHERATARFWADFVDKKILETIRQLAWAPKNKDKTAASMDLVESVKTLEGLLGDKPYFGGEDFGFVDVATIPIYCSFKFVYTCETVAKISFAEEYPKLAGWIKRCLQKESVSKSLPDKDKVNEFLDEVKKRIGLE